MHVVYAKSEFSEFKAKAFKLFESYCAGIYNALSPESFVSAFGQKLKDYPVVSRVFRMFFIAKAT